MGDGRKSRSEAGVAIEGQHETFVMTELFRILTVVVIKLHNTKYTHS